MLTDLRAESLMNLVLVFVVVVDTLGLVVNSLVVVTVKVEDWIIRVVIVLVEGMTLVEVT